MTRTVLACCTTATISGPSTDDAVAGDTRKGCIIGLNELSNGFNGVFRPILSAYRETVTYPYGEPLVRAEDLLPGDVNQTERDGVAIRKGTVGAFLVNAKVWCDATAGPAQRVAAERDIIDAIPALRALGLFEVFSIRDAALRQLVETH